MAITIMLLSGTASITYASGVDYGHVELQFHGQRIGADVLMKVVLSYYFAVCYILCSECYVRFHHPYYLCSSAISINRQGG